MATVLGQDLADRPLEVVDPEVRLLLLLLLLLPESTAEIAHRHGAAVPRGRVRKATPLECRGYPRAGGGRAGRERRPDCR